MAPIRREQCQQITVIIKDRFVSRKGLMAALGHRRRWRLCRMTAASCAAFGMSTRTLSSFAVIPTAVASGRQAGIPHNYYGMPVVRPSKFSFLTNGMRYCVCFTSYSEVSSRSNGATRHKSNIALRISSTTSRSENLISSWSERIQTAFRHEGTDGIVKLAFLSESNPMIFEQLPVADLWQATIQAVNGSSSSSNNNKGQAASILNAWIAVCCKAASQEDGDVAQYALDLFTLACYGNKDNNESYDDFTVQPDIVTYSLLYSVLNLCSTHKEEADEVLQQAQRMSKKAAGSKRRRAMAAARRRQKQPSRTAAPSFQQAEPEIRDLLGEDFAVLYENDDLVVVNKPAGVTSFHKHTTTAGKRRKRKNGNNKQADISLEDALLSPPGLSLSMLNAEARGLVHRLDRGTSGCMVLAKNDAMHARLVTEFFLRHIHKMYTCLVTPAPSSSKDGDSGVIDTLVNGRPARSKYTVLERFEKEDGDDGNSSSSAALLQVETITGRKHQVRIHCAQGLNCPILGDDMYSGNNKNRKNNNKENNPNGSPFFLHASSLSIPSLQLDGNPIEAPLPDWWTAMLNHWRDNS